MPIADKGDVGEISWFIAIRQQFPARRTKHSAVKDFTMAKRAIHRGNYNALAPRRHGNADPAPLGNGDIDIDIVSNQQDGSTWVISAE